MTSRGKRSVWSGKQGCCPPFVRTVRTLGVSDSDCTRQNTRFSSKTLIPCGLLLLPIPEPHMLLAGREGLRPLPRRVERNTRHRIHQRVISREFKAFEDRNALRRVLPGKHRFSGKNHIRPSRLHGRRRRRNARLSSASSQRSDAHDDRQVRRYCASHRSG